MDWHPQRADFNILTENGAKDSQHPKKVQDCPSGSLETM